MAKRRLWWCSGFLAAVILLGAVLLGVLLKHEPAFYTKPRDLPSDIRHDEALKFASNFAQMRTDVAARRETWFCNATETQIDSFLEERFPQFDEAKKLCKLGITDPMIALDDDCIRVAFRFGTGWFSTVVSYDLQVWLVPKEPNAVAVKVLRARAGGVPISSQSIMHRLADIAHDQNIDITLYRHEGKSVAILKLGGGGDPLNPSWILTTLKVGKSGDGPVTLAIAGRTPEHVLTLPVITPMKTSGTP